MTWNDGVSGTISSRSALRSSVGLDVGGTSIRVLASGAPLGQIRRAEVSRATSLDEFVTITGGLLDAVDPDKNAAVTIALPTFIEESGQLTECPSLPALTGVYLAELLAFEHARPLPQLVPDLSAAVIGESRLGSGVGVERFLCVALGTGANAAATRDGQIINTAYNSLGDAGHVMVDPAGPMCACGGHGCLESITSGWALGREAKRLGFQNAAALSAAAANSDSDGHAAAAATLEYAGICLGRAIATWSALLWPQTVAIAGGVAAAGELLLAPARRELARVGVPYIVRDLSIVPAVLGDAATLLGCVALAEDSPHE